MPQRISFLIQVIANEKVHVNRASVHSHQELGNNKVASTPDPRFLATKRKSGGLLFYHRAIK